MSKIRHTKTHVKTSKERKIGSTMWLQRQLNDPLVKQAKIDGWRSRAAYKLLDIDAKFKILKNGKKVLDLGAAPGGWKIAAIDPDGCDLRRGEEVLRPAFHTPVYSAAALRLTLAKLGVEARG